MSKLSNELDRRARLLAEQTQLVQHGLKTPEARAEHTRLTSELDSSDDSSVCFAESTDSRPLLVPNLLSLPLPSFTSVIRQNTAPRSTKRPALS
jgi:hypothetical protein